MSTWPVTGMTAVPPPTRTWKPGWPPWFLAKKPRSWMAAAAWSSAHPSKAILNLRGSEVPSGWRRKWRVSASA